jgi:hypothetical protein
MGTFESPLRIEATEKTISGRPIYKVLEKFSYEVGGKGSGIYIDVPAGFYTDFASVPRFLWFIFQPDGQHGKAAVIHDYMYRKRCKFSRILADAIFLDAMRTLKVPLWKRYMMYLAVRVFGWSSFNKEM